MVATLGGLSDAGPQGPWKWIVFGLGVVLVAVALVITTRATKRVLASSGG